MYSPPQMPPPVDEPRPQKPGLSEGVKAFTVCGIVVAVLAWILVPLFQSARDKAHSVICQTNLKQMAVGVILYTEDNGDRMPVSGYWMDAIYGYVTEKNPDDKTFLYTCPSVPQEEYSYAFYEPLSSVKTLDIPAPALTLMIYDSNNHYRNSKGYGTDLPVDGRHNGRNNLAFADGHVHVSSPDGRYTPPDAKPAR